MNKPQISTVLAEMTPDLYLKLMSGNTSNRKPRRQAAERMSNDIAAGRWIFTGDTIKVSTDGVLLDGQHRLMAWDRSGRPRGMWVLIVYGVMKEAQMVMDRHAKRSVTDCLALSLNITATTQMVAALNVIGRVGLTGTRFKWHPMTETEMAMCFEEWIDDFQAISSTGVRIYRSAVIAALMQYRSYSEGDAMAFASSLATGEGLSKGDPILALRNYIIKTVGGGGTQAAETYAKCVAAICAHAERRTIDKVYAADEWSIPVRRVSRGFPGEE